MNNKLHLVALALLASLFVACSSSDKTPQTVKSNNRTVLIYIAAANTLGYLGLDNDDLKEMEQGLALVDEADLELANISVYREYSSSSTRSAPELLKLERKGDDIFWKKLKDYDAQISTDKKVMSEVFNFVYSSFKADTYGLILWSHADGWLYGGHDRWSKDTRWFGQDIDGNKKFYMDIPDLAKALEVAPHLDFILFDACFMQSIEVAYELQGVADYMLGSAMEIPGPGAPYQELIPLFFQKEKSIAYDIADAYYGYYDKKYNGGLNSSNSNWTSGVSMGVLDLKFIESFTQTTLSVLKANGLKYTDLDFSNVMYYDKQDEDRRQKYYYMDMKGVMKKNIKVGYAEWERSFNKLLPFYKTTHTNFSFFASNIVMDNSFGLSFYVPRKEIPGYYTFKKENAYYEKLGWAKRMLAPF